MVRRFVLQILFPTGDGGQPDTGVITQALGEMPDQFKALESAYAGRDFLAGASLSAADLFLAPILAYVKAMPDGAALMAAYPNVLHAHEVVTRRPSFTTTRGS
jgi:glutathione S-transferase